jgi:hypothetical protein
MIYLTTGPNEIPRICGKNCQKITLTDQMTKKSYTYDLVEANNGAWYVLYLSVDLPTSQYNMQVFGDDGEVVVTMLAQFGEFVDEKTEYAHTSDIKTYNR